MNNEIKEKIKKMELKYKFIKDQIKRELFFEFAKKLKGKWKYLTVHMYEMKSDPNYEKEVEGVFKELIEEYEKGYDSGYKTKLDELQEMFNNLEQRYETKRDAIFKLETIQGKQINELNEKVESLKDVEQSRDNIKEVLRKLGYDYIKHMKEEHSYIIPLNIEKSLAKLDGVGVAKQTVKQDDPFKFCSKCGYSGNVRDIVCPECHNSRFKREKPENIEDSDSKNTVALTSHRKRETSLTDESPDESPDDSPDLKLPESTCEVCGKLMIKNQGCWFCICGHWKGQYNKNIEIDEEAWECPICHKTVFVGYTTHKYCLDNLISKVNKMLEKTNKGIEMISEEIESIGEWDVKEDLVGLVNQLQGYLGILKKEYQEIL